MKEILILAFYVSFGRAVFQRITFHESHVEWQNNSFTFLTPVSDISKLPLTSVVRFCHTSSMRFYAEGNFLGVTTNFSYVGEDCHNINISNYKSFRFFGNESTEVDVVTLYQEEDLCGGETYVDHSPYAGIVGAVKSLAHTGKSSWTLFEGRNFDGKSVCLAAGDGTDSVSVPRIQNITLTNVQSLFKGCPSSSELSAVAAGFRSQLGLH